MKTHFVIRLASFFMGIAFYVSLAKSEPVTFGIAGPNQFTMDFVRIGNPGNAPDVFGEPTGVVDYTYGIGKYEVSRDMITKANSSGLGVTLSDLSGLGGNGVNRPATGMSWNEAARFVNWLNTSQGFPVAYKFAVQPGSFGYNSNANLISWTASDSGFNPSNPFRNSLARYALPTDDEWYKAAYYSPVSATYSIYPTNQSTAPTPVFSGTNPGSAVYFQTSVHGPADVNQAGGLSAYGTMGQGGNVNEWMETTTDLLNDSPLYNRSIRGGNWFDNTPAEMASYVLNLSGNPTDHFGETGFRVVELPEPSSTALLVLGAIGVVFAARRRMKVSAA